MTTDPTETAQALSDYGSCRRCGETRLVAQVARPRREGSIHSYIDYRCKTCGYQWTVTFDRSQAMNLLVPIAYAERG